MPGIFGFFEEKRTAALAGWLLFFFVVFVVFVSPATAAQQLGSLFGSVACGPTSDDCSAKASFYQDSPSFTTDYYGDVTVEVDWTMAGSGFYSWERDFYASFKAWVNSSLSDDSGSIHCYDGGNGCSKTGKLSFKLTSPNATVSRTVKIKARAWGEGEDCSKEAQKSVSVTRPMCPTSLNLTPIDNKSQNHSQITVSGTVSDDGCGASFSDNGSVTVVVKDPDGSAILNTVLNLSSGSFSTTCNLADEDDPDSYGTYIVTATYDAMSPTGHDRDDSGAADTETFDRKYVLQIPSPPSAVACYSEFDQHRLAFDDFDDWHVYIYDLGAIEPTVEVNLTGLIVSPPQGIEFVTFSPLLRMPDPYLAVTQETGNQVVFLDLDGLPVMDYPAPTPHPYGLAFDGGGLWIADFVSGDLFRCEVTTGAVLRSLYPGVGGIADIDWDDDWGSWGKATLLAMVPDGVLGDRIYRIDPDDGSVLESRLLDASTHRGVTCLGGVTYVADFDTRDFYPMYDGTPAAPDGLAAFSDATTPETILLTWSDPDLEPPWNRVWIYRDGTFLDEVPAGVEEYTDSGLATHSYHEYFLTAVNTDEGRESASSNTVATYVECRPPMALRVPADFESIQLGIFAASPGDTVLVDPGSYPGPLRFDGREIRVLSTGGPHVTFVEGDSLPFSLVQCDSTEGSGTEFSGFTVRGGDLRHGTGVIHVGPDASPTIAGNVITGNELWYGGGGILCEGGGGGVPILRNNTISGNIVWPDLLAEFEGGGITCLGASPVIENNIVAANDSCGYGIYNVGGSPALSCNDVWDSFLASYFGCDPGAGDISEDPLFCDAGSGDYRLCADSPCASGYSCGPIGALGAACGACGSTLDWASHDAGNCILTVTAQGSLGFLDNTQTQGDGLIYPADGGNLLFTGSLWVGESETYVANRDYDADTAKEWAVSASPNGHLWVDGVSGHANQVILGSYRDSDASVPRGLRVRQESWAFAAPELATAVVVLQYRIENEGPTALENLYAGLFLDFDLDAATDNTGAADASRQLAYLTGPSGLHVGAQRLDVPDGPPLGNLTLIHNPTFVWPQAHVLDLDKYAFLSASDPGHVQVVADTPDDYSLLVSSGPFSLPPASDVHLAFAVLGAESLDELLASSHVAHMLVVPGVTDTPIPVVIPVQANETFLHPAVPNPMRGSVRLTFDLHESSPVRLTVYDVGGRQIRSLIDEPYAAGRHVASWDGRDDDGRRVATGIYFFNLATKSQSIGRRLVVLR